MVKIFKDEEDNIIGWKHSFDSWFKSDNYTERELLYFDIIQNTHKIQLPNGEWTYIDLEPHQCEYHRFDVACKGVNAPIRVVIKARNVSFTVDSIISENMAIGEYKNQIVPLFRINTQRSIDFIDEFKEHNKHMTPIKIELEDGSFDYIPFDKTKLKLDKALSIKYPNGTELRAFAANADASEATRGIRFRGNAGIIDEANFMRSFSNIRTAIDDAAAGHFKGEQIFQYSIGSTLKGITPFSFFVDDVAKSKSDRIKLFKFTIFNPDLFKQEGYIDKERHEVLPFKENPKLKLLCSWHDMDTLWDKYCFNKQKFLEEYMGHKVDSEYQFYPTELVMEQAKMDNVEDIRKIPFEDAELVRMGVDPASVNDKFSISIVLKIDGKWKEYKVVNKNKVDLSFMETECYMMIDYILTINNDLLVTIDATPIGLQLKQNLARSFPEHVRGVTGNKRIKYDSQNSVKLNEYLHNNLKTLMMRGELEIINDETHIQHFASVMSDYKIESNEFGHGDSVMSLGYALLPDVLNEARIENVKTNLDEQVEEEDSDLLSKVRTHRKRQKMKKSGMVKY